MQGYPRGKWLDGHFDGLRRLKVAWGSDAVTMLEALEGTAWPYASGPNACTPWQATIKPFPNCRQQGSGSLASYEFALVDVFYTTRGPVWNTSLGYRVQETTSSYTRVGKISPKDGSTNRLYWDNAGANPIHRDDAPMGEWHGMAYKLTFSGLTSAPSGAWDYIKYVNSNVVTSYTLDRSFAPETLLYKGASIQANYAWGKLTRYGVTYSFLYWPPGHNRVFRPGYGHVDAYYREGGSSVIYKTYDSAPFFIVE